MKYVVDGEALAAVVKDWLDHGGRSRFDALGWSVVRALTPVADGGEAVPFEEGAESGGLVVEYALASQRKEQIRSAIRAAFADPRAVEATAKRLLAEYGDHDEGLHETAQDLLAAACETVLATRSGNE